MPEKIPKLFFKSKDIDDFDSEMKGYRNDVFVITPDGKIYEVFFYDFYRIRTEKGSAVGVGHFIAAPGMIVLETVNKISMEAAVIDLWKRGFFKYFIPRPSLTENHFDENI